MTHRSFLSHGLIIGSLIRITILVLLYTIVLASVSVVAFVVVGRSIAPTWLSDLIKWPLFCWWVKGIIAGDSLHVAMDWWYSLRKKHETGAKRRSASSAGNR